MVRVTRRAVLGAGVGTLTALAGCLGGSEAQSDGGTDGAGVQASFYVTGDFTATVADEAATAGTLVPVGQHGHGWEPGPRIQQTVFDADLFVMVMPGFQPWADDVAANIAGGDAETRVVHAAEGIDLLASGDAGHGDEEVHDDHDTDEEGHDEHGDEEDHDGLEVDPHFWLDPVRAAEAVVNVRDALVGVDPDAEEAYHENAAAYVDELRDLDTTFETGLADRDQDVILVAGHNAFQYLGDRYGLRVEALTGLAPDDTPGPGDVERAQSVIEEHGIEYVMSPVLESDRAARILVEETGAVDSLPLTPIPGQTRSWAEDGWGYAEVMRNVNLPSLRTALGVG